MSVCIEVWSDYVCPFCYLEQPVLDEIAREFAGRVDIRWRAFELRPEPIPTLDPNGSYLREVWSRSVHPMARERGMTLRLPPVQPRSRAAHEAAKFAEAQGCFDAMNRALFRAFFEDGHDIGRTDVLSEIGRSVGLDPAALDRALHEGTFRDAVLRDEAEAKRLGLTGVPAMAFHKKKNDPAAAPFAIVSGPQPESVLRGALAEMISSPAPAG